MVDFLMKNGHFYRSPKCKRLPAKQIQAVQHPRAQSPISLESLATVVGMSTVGSEITGGIEQKTYKHGYNNG